MILYQQNLLNSIQNQWKNKKRRHRPKALKDGQSAKEGKSTALEPPMDKGNQPTVKSKYAARKQVNTPTEQPQSEDTHMQNKGAKPIPARRCLDFTGANRQVNTDPVTHFQVREIPTVPADAQSSSTSKTESIHVQVACHRVGTGCSISSLVNPLTGLQHLREDTMSDRVNFGMNCSVNQMPSKPSYTVDCSGPFSQFGQREIIQADRLLHFTAGIQEKSVPGLDAYEVMNSSESSNTKAPHPQHNRSVPLRGNFNPEAWTREAVMAEEMCEGRAAGHALAPAATNTKKLASQLHNEGSLLWIPPSEHRASCPQEQQRTLTIRGRHKAIKYSKLCAPALKRLQIEQVSQMNDIPIDHNLIHALIERWREETNSFHMPMGEMTVTLQDVSCLWGLPVKGKPVTGRSEDWMCYVPRLLGVDIDDIRSDKYYFISLKKLREKFKEMPTDEKDPYTNHYTRAFALDLFGSVIFPDGTGNKVPAMYLQFLEDLDGEVTYNFGAASLTLLYKELCRSARAHIPTFAAPVQLLMRWSWARLDIGRPVGRVQEEIEWGDPDAESCALYGARWNTSTKFKKIPLSDYRQKLNEMDDSLVTWTPYANFMSRMPTHVQNSRDIWLARIPVIHFWFVEQHCPDRVMRQFGLFQTIPPPVPLKKHEIDKMHKFSHHSPNRQEDWSIIQKEYVDKWSDVEGCTLREHRLYDPTTLDDYLRWFDKVGMPTVDFRVSQINAFTDQIHSTDSFQNIGKKRHHSDSNNPRISSQKNFQHSNSAWPQYNDPLCISSPTSYFTETCKNMRLEDSLNGDMGKHCSSPASNWNTNEVPTINSGDCTMAEFQCLTAPEASPSRFCQQMVGDMVQQQNKDTVHNIWGKYLLASPETQLQHTPSMEEVMGHPTKRDETPCKVYSRKKRKEDAKTKEKPKHRGAKGENVYPAKCMSSNVVNIECISCGSEPSAKATPETKVYALETDGWKAPSILENSEHDKALKGNVKKNLPRARVNTAEGMDTDKEKWHGELRHLLERIILFVNKIGKVQGDRSFSPWKGSVLDSMVGVLLTQNVGDHLSSYAFMELTAKFPVKSECPDKPEAEISCTRPEQEDGCSSLFDNSVKLQRTRTMQMGNEKLRNQHAHSDVSQGVASDPIGLSEDTPKGSSEISTEKSLQKKPPGRTKKKARPKRKDGDWDNLRKQALRIAGDKLKSDNPNDSVDWEAVRQATLSKLAKTIELRGMQKKLSYRIQQFLNRLVRDHGSFDLEWLRYVKPHEAKKFILSIKGFGLKSAECVCLLTLHHAAFPVDTNVARICVRLGWVPLDPLPESLLLHLLKVYPMDKHIHKYLWARLCQLDQEKLYELHYHLITLGKFFCTKKQPNCNFCPVKDDCKHFASACASAKLALPAPEGKSLVSLQDSDSADIQDMEDLARDDPNEFPMTYLNNEDFIKDGDMSKALVSLTSEYPFNPSPNLKNVSLGRRKRKHKVYELLEDHNLLAGFDKKLPEDPSPYLLYVWTPGETAQSTDTPMALRTTRKELHAEIVRGTILMPVRRALRGSFPLNGTYFQVNEVFADHESSKNPIEVPQSAIEDLPTPTVHFGTSVTTIFKGLTIDEAIDCFSGYICVKGFDRTKRAPKPLCVALSYPGTKLATKGKRKATNTN